MIGSGSARASYGRAPMRCGRGSDTLEERGVPPHQSLLPQSFPDDTQFEFGIVVAPDRRAFHFSYDYLHRSPGEGTVTEWEEFYWACSKRSWGKEILVCLAVLRGL